MTAVKSLLFSLVLFWADWELVWRPRRLKIRYGKLTFLPQRYCLLSAYFWKKISDTGTADSFFQERNISFSTSLVILCLPLTEHHCLCIFLFLRWTTLCSFRCTSTHIHLKLNYFGHLSYFYRWLTRGTCSVQQPWQSCIWGSSSAAKWTSQAPTRSLLIHLLFIHFIFDQQAGRLI